MSFRRGTDTEPLLNGGNRRSSARSRNPRPPVTNGGWVATLVFISLFTIAAGILGIIAFSKISDSNIDGSYAKSLTVDDMCVTDILVKSTLEAPVAHIGDANITVAIAGEATIGTATIETATVNTATIETATIDTATIETATVNTATIETATIDTATIETATVETATIDTAAIETATVETAAIDTASLNMASFNELEITESGEMPSTHNNILLNSDTGIDMTYPADLTPYIGKEIKICAIGDAIHSVDIGAAGASWANGAVGQSFMHMQGSIAATTPCCMTFHVNNANDIHVVSRDPCIDVCDGPELNLCQGDLPKFNGFWRQVTPVSRATQTWIAGNDADVSYLFEIRDIDPLVTYVQFDYLLSFPREYTKSVRVYCGPWNDLVECARNAHLNNLFGGPVYYGADRDTLLFRATSSNMLEDTDIGLAVQNLDGWTALSTPSNTLTLSGDGTRLVLHHRQDNLQYDHPMEYPVFERVTGGDIPPIRQLSTTYPAAKDNNDVVQMFLNTVNMVLDTHIQTQAADDHYIGRAAAVALRDLIVSTGVVETTNVIEVIRSTHANGRFFNPNSPSPPSDPTGTPAMYVSGVRTDALSTVNIHSEVSFDGFTGDWAALNNGSYPVTTRQMTTFSETNNDFMDYSATPASSSFGYYQTFSADTRAFSASFTGTPTMDVAHGPITSSSDFRVMTDAFQYWVQRVFGNKLIGAYTKYLGIRQSNRGLLRISTATEWNYNSPVVAIDLTTHSVPVHPIHINAQKMGRILFTAEHGTNIVNDPFYVPGSFFFRESDMFNYHIARHNYVTGKQVLYRRLDGENEDYGTDVGGPFGQENFDVTGQKSGSVELQIVASLLYAYGSSGDVGRIGKTWAGEILPMGDTIPAGFSFVSETVFGTNCDGFQSYFGCYGTRYATLPPSWIDESKEEFFFGQIDTALTGGENIGYIRLDTLFYGDLFNYVRTCAQSPIEDTPRCNREATANILYPMMYHLVTTLEVKSIIVDIRSAGGGGFRGTGQRSIFGLVNELVIRAFREFFGVDQLGLQTTTSGKFGVDGVTVDLTQFAADVPEIQKELGQQRIFAAHNKATYPGAQFENGPVVFLTDGRGSDGMNYILHSFVGDNEDRQLGEGVAGADVRSYILGSVSGATHGARHVEESISPMVFLNQPEWPPTLYGFGPFSQFPIAPMIPQCAITEHPVSGSWIGNRIDALKPDEGVLLSAASKSGGNPFSIAVEDMAHPDYGYIANPHARLTGDTRPQTPRTNEATDPFTVTANGTILVTATAHGYNNGDLVRFYKVEDTVGGGATRQTLVNTEYTVAGATANTFTIDEPAAEVINAVGTGGAGVIMTIRSEWRDSWLEDAVRKVLDVLPSFTFAKKKKRAVLKPKKKTRSKRTHTPTHPCPTVMDGAQTQSMLDLKIIDGRMSQQNQSAVLAWVRGELLGGGLCQTTTGAWMPNMGKLRIMPNITHVTSSATSSF